MLWSSCLARIDAIDPAVQAWRYVAHDSARAEADLLDREAKAGSFRGPLHGIPVGIKDIIDVVGMTTLANSKLRANSARVTADDEIVAALRLAGAVILGKTHTTEFAYFDPSPARNPHNIAHTPGGSSSGSAAAVGAGAVPLAVGTQTVASVNRPAAYCGVAAFKPSTQSTCTHGITPLAPAFDMVGFFGATVADAVALYEAVAPAFTAPFDHPSGRRYNILRLRIPRLRPAMPRSSSGWTKPQEPLQTAVMLCALQSRLRTSRQFLRPNCASCSTKRRGFIAGCLICPRSWSDRSSAK